MGEIKKNNPKDLENLPFNPGESLPAGFNINDLAEANPSLADSLKKAKEQETHEAEKEERAKKELEQAFQSGHTIQVNEKDFPRDLQELLEKRRFEADRKEYKELLLLQNRDNNQEKRFKFLKNQLEPGDSGDE